MTRQNGAYFDEEYLRQGSPTNTTFAESIPRWAAGSDCVIGATGLMTSVAIPLQYGDVVTSLTFVSGGTAADTPTHWGFALYSSAATPALLAQTADKTTTAWAANTVKTVALATPQLITAPGIYYAAVWMVATAQVTLVGTALQDAVVGGNLGLSAALLARTSGSGLTATAPATIATPTAIVGIPYAVAT